MSNGDGDGDALIGFFFVLVGLTLLIAVGTLAAVVWLVISTVGMKARKAYLEQKARERIEERFEREDSNVPIDDVFAAMDIGGVEIDNEQVDDDDFLGGILLGMGSKVHDG